MPSSQLSLATKTSWKDDVGGWEPGPSGIDMLALGSCFAGSKVLTSLSRANCVAANSSAKSCRLPRGLPSRRKAWEIRVEFVRKLDRAVPRESNDGNHG